jgi:hypothetical protein
MRLIVDVQKLQGLAPPAQELNFCIKFPLLPFNSRKKNYAGSKTFPTSIKEKEKHWPEVP